ncbi:MAG: hypothetical protein IJF34_05515 [Clostridia bacterium]|nr:hypothetical protein [Clostridia bacterium]
MINQKTVRAKLKPFIQEAAFQGTLDGLLMMMLSVTLTIAEFPFFLGCCIVVAYLIIAFLLHYRILVLALIDKKNGNYITELLSVNRIKEEYVFAGNHVGETNARLFYPKEKHIRRYKILVIDDSGKEKNLRIVLSLASLFDFIALKKYGVDQLQITYLPKSKIVLSLDLPPRKSCFNHKSEKDVHKVLRRITNSI